LGFFDGRFAQRVASANAIEVSVMNPTPIKLITAGQAATLLGVRITTLESWRLRGTGPCYRKIGRLVRYVEDEVLAWIDTQMRTSTSQQKA